MDVWVWIGIAVALVVALAALAVGVTALRRAAVTPLPQAAPALSADGQEGTPEPEKPGPPVVIYNPSKDRDWDALRAVVERIATDASLPAPVYIGTTPEDPGAGQAREALTHHPSVVVAAGGDGTVRAVATALAGTGVPMGLLPLGTGNLFARNLDLPLTNPREMVTIALTGRERPVDVGWLRVHGQEDGTNSDPATRDGDHLFLVIAGMGFDANMVDATDEGLKSRIGWLAYFFGASKFLWGSRIDFTLRLGTAGAPARVKARTIMVANCGRLPGGLVLSPDAQYDDGWLDIIAVDTRGGLIGWTSLAGKVVLQGMGLRTTQDLISRMAFRRGRSIRMTAPEPEGVQVDGDVVGRATTVEAFVDPGALLVRTP